MQEDKTYIIGKYHKKIFQRVSLLIIVVALPCITLLVSTHQIPLLHAANSTQTVVVNATNKLGIIQTQLSTNNVWSGMLDQAPGGQSRLNALHAPLVRIHVGDDGSPIAMPETKQGNWDFSALDVLVNDVRKTGQYPLMNIKFAPDWMWTCTKLYTAGDIKDKTFQTYADYMARLVSYYNTGRMSTEAGTVITNPAGTAKKTNPNTPNTEPDLSNETLCWVCLVFGLTPTEYVTMWNAVTTKMLAVDSTLKFVGPATAGSQFGSSTATGNDYVDNLMNNGVVKPGAISFHGYGYWDNTVTDKTIFDGDSTGSGGIPDILNGVKSIHSKYPSIPIWLTEVNVNADWGNDTYNRPSTALGAAWWGTLFATLVPQKVDLINQYDVVDSPQFGLISDQTGTPYLPYWEFMTLNNGFPSGSTIVSTNSSDPNIVALAAQRPNGMYSVLVVNRLMNSSTPRGGSGLPATITIDLQGINPTGMQFQQIDSSTNLATGPVTQTLSVSTSPQLTLGGYGFAVVTVATDGTVMDTSSSTPTLTTSATPISSPTGNTKGTPTGNTKGTPVVTATNNDPTSSNNTLIISKHVSSSGQAQLPATPVNVEPWIVPTTLSAIAVSGGVGLSLLVLVRRKRTTKRR